jgi:hypothetical protein
MVMEGCDRVSFFRIFSPCIWTWLSFFSFPFFDQALHGAGIFFCFCFCIAMSFLRMSAKNHNFVEILFDGVNGG